MKRLISLIVMLAFCSNIALADCDFSTGITANPDGSRTYTKECHIKVGQIKQDLDIANSQLTDYKKAIELKDLAITKSDQRADMWREATFKLEDRVSTIESLQGKNQFLYFGLGVVATIGAAWAASRLLQR